MGNSGSAAVSFIDLLTAVMLMCSDKKSCLGLNIIWIIGKKK